MKIGIDASNIRAGGGITHLRELLQSSQPDTCNFDSIVVWGGKKTLDQMPEQEWIKKVHIPLLDGSLFKRLIWQNLYLTNVAKKFCDVLFIPGANYTGRFSPFITMSQNLLPFDYNERARFKFSWTYLRYILVEKKQSKSFSKADGIIFLTNTAKNVVEAVTGKLKMPTSIVPHGVFPSFYKAPRQQRNIEEYSLDTPYKLLYVSIVNYYKHQWNVVEAVARLRNKGLPITLDLVGPAYSKALPRLNRAIEKYDPQGVFVNYHGSVEYSELPSYYHRADAFVFASSCENLPNILLEGMASGLPIVCSKSGPMPEVLGDSGVYFDPENVSDLERVLLNIILDRELRRRCASSAYSKSKTYTWDKCAQQTFSFISNVYNNIKLS